MLLEWFSEREIWKENAPEASLVTNEIKSDFLKGSYERKTLQNENWKNGTHFLLNLPSENSLRSDFVTRGTSWSPDCLESKNGNWKNGTHFFLKLPSQNSLWGDFVTRSTLWSPGFLQIYPFWIRHNEIIGLLIHNHWNTNYFIRPYAKMNIIWCRLQMV